ncbi:MAG: thiamine diphosphokinase [Acidimicrobiia bacterium]
MGSHGRAIALVFTGGDAPEPRDIDDLGVLAPEAIVIAADSGLHHAQRLGQRVDVVVGDFDSVDPTALSAAESGGAEIERHPTAKDATDLELALVAARERGVERVVVVGGAGGRLDHFLANALVLASEEFSTLRIEARLGGARVHVVRDRVELRGELGDVVTLIPLGGPAHGVVTEELRFPLHGETLHPGSTRGVSNELVAPLASVSLAAGVLLAVMPGTGPDASSPTPPTENREARP